jgi:hypothetical protein
MPAIARHLTKAAANVRWLVVTATFILTAGTTLAILGTALWGWQFGLGHADLASRISTVVAVCAFILVAATLAVALIAYLAATGRPELQPQLQFRFSDVNMPVLEAAPPRTGEDFLHRRYLANWRQTECTVRLVNSSRYSARNASVRVWLDCLGLRRPQPDWTVLTMVNAIGPIELQWDGGADSLIHGNWSRVLPMLNFQDAYATRTDPLPEIVVTVAADGVKPTTTRIPVRILDADEYRAHRAERAAVRGDPPVTVEYKTPADEPTG